jgi:hypothetical protein
MNFVQISLLGLTLAFASTARATPPTKAALDAALEGIERKQILCACQDATRTGLVGTLQKAQVVIQTHPTMVCAIPNLNLRDPDSLPPYQCRQFVILPATLD